MEAIIETGGKQYRVKKGQKLTVDKIIADLDSELSFHPLITFTSDQCTVGAPQVAKATVTAKVIRQSRGDKVVSATYKRRKGLHKKKGHRQLHTEIEIKDITVA